jgi:hypothetical protein
MFEDVAAVPLRSETAPTVSGILRIRLKEYPYYHIRHHAVTLEQRWP